MNITIKDIPPRLHRKLKACAKANNRSLNGEVINRLEISLGDLEERERLLQEIDEFRSSLKVPPLTEEFLREAKNWGRS